MKFDETPQELTSLREADGVVLKGEARGSVSQKCKDDLEQETHPSGKLRDGLELVCNRLDLLVDVAEEAGFAILADVVVDPDVVDEETRVACLEIARELSLQTGRKAKLAVSSKIVCQRRPARDLPCLPTSRSLPGHAR